MNMQLNYKVEIPPLKLWYSSLGRNASPFGNHWPNDYQQFNSRPCQRVQECEISL